MAADIQDLNPVFADRLRRFLEAARAQGIDPGAINSGFRTIAQQSQLYNDLLAGRRAGPVAPPGSSMHNFGMAVDISSPQIMALRRFANSNPQFGVYPLPGDTPHFQLAGNQRELMASPPTGASFDVAQLKPFIAPIPPSRPGIPTPPSRPDIQVAGAPLDLGTTLNSVPQNVASPVPDTSTFQQMQTAMQGGNPGGMLSALTGNKDIMGGLQGIAQNLGGGDRKSIPNPMPPPNIQDNSVQIAAMAPQLMAMLRQKQAMGLSLGGLYA